MTAVEIRLVPLDASRLHELPAGVVVEDRYGVRWVREDRADDGDRWTAILTPDVDPSGIPVHARAADYVLAARAGLFLVVPVPAGFALRPAVRPLGEDGPATGEWELPELVSPSPYDVRRDALNAAAQLALPMVVMNVDRTPENLAAAGRQAAAISAAAAEVLEEHLTRPYPIDVTSLGSTERETLNGEQH